MKKCLYAGCKSDESSHNIFHKVVGSTGRDGNPLYICSVHFARLKSSKSQKPLSKPAPATRKVKRLTQGNKRQLNAKDEEEERRINLGEKGIVQNEVEGKTTDVSEKRKDIQELRTFGPRRRSSLPSILRRKSGDNVSNLRQEAAKVSSTPNSFQSSSFSRETESTAKGTVVVEDEEELGSVRQKRELEHNQKSEIEVGGVNQEHNETKIQSENNTEVKRCDVNKSKEDRSCGTSTYPTWLLDKFIYEYDNNEVNSSALQTFSTTSPEQHPVENKQNREETGPKGSPNGSSTLAINNLTSLEAKECNKNEIENSGHNENYKLEVHNQERTINKQQAFEILKHNQQGNVENKYYLVAKKVNSTIKYCLVKKDSVNQSGSNNPNIEMKKLRLKGSATSLNLEKKNYSKEVNEAPLGEGEGDQMVEEETIDEHNLERNPGDERNTELKKSSHEKSKMKSIISLGVNEPNILNEFRVKKEGNVKMYANNVRKKKKHSQEKGETNNRTDREIDDGNLMESRVNKDCLERIELEKKGVDEYNVELWMECYDELNVEEHPILQLSIEGHALYDFDIDEYQLLLSVEANRPNQLSFDQYDEFLNGEVHLQSRFGEYVDKYPHEVTVGGLVEDRKKGDATHFLKGRSCSAAGCDSKFPEVRLFRFPCYGRAKTRHKIWSEFVNRDVLMGYLCHRHFRVVDFLTPDRIKLNRGANPSYHTGPLNPITQDYCPFEDSGGPKEAVYCSALNCGLSQKTHPDVTFAAFPSKADSRYQEWLNVAGAVRNPRFLCARHFDSTQFSDNARTYLKNRAIPQYMSGPLNPKTNDYSPIQQDDLENSPGNSPASVIEIDVTNDSPDTDQNIKISATSRAVGQSNNISADRPLVGQKIKVISGSPLVGQKINISAASLTSQNKKIPSVSGFLGQKVKIAPVDSAVSKIAVVTTNAGENIKTPSTSLAKFGPTSFNEKDDTSNNDEQDQMHALYLRCDALGCPSSYKSDPSVKYFSFPGKANNSSASEKKRRQHWIDAVGGTKENRSNYLCQYHFATDVFYDKKRTSLVRRTNPLFPYGPLNPVTKDYCPIGEEQRSLNSRNFSRARCCVDGCSTYSFNTSGLFGFPMHDREAYEEWTRRVGVHKYFSEQHIRMKFRICPKHFSSCCTIVDEDTNSIRLKFGALPTINVPCFKGPPTIRNSFVQIRKMSTDEIEALKMLSESDRICDLHDICDKENDEQTSLELKRKMIVSNYTKLVPIKKSKDDSSTADDNKQLILLPIQDESGQQTYVVADFSTNENFASISGQSQNVESDGSFQTSVQQSSAAEGVKDETKVEKLLKTPVCSYWSPEEIFDKHAVKKKMEDRMARVQLARLKAKPNPSARFRLRSGVNKTRVPLGEKPPKRCMKTFLWASKKITSGMKLISTLKKTLWNSQ
uniref:THAP-type domain-containing protein n=1 Tax=Lygus hesperus TaxID=30085 RepID=A0A0A9YL41_LYGHE